MSDDRRKNSILSVLIACLIVFSGIAAVFCSQKITVALGKGTEGGTLSRYFNSTDMDDSWSTEDATFIYLSGNTAKTDGNGVYVSGSSVYIMKPGKYVISGTLSDGSIVIDTDKSSKVYLLLDNADVRCSENAALRIEQADKVVLTLAEGSSNCLASGSAYSEEAIAGEVTGALHSHDDLTINGSGSLTVSSEYRHGIVAKDDLVITGGLISVSAPGDAIRANDSLRIRNASISVSAGDDGMVLNKENGYFYIESGHLDIESSDDAIHSDGNVTIAGGDISISAGDDGIHSDTAFVISGGNLKINKCSEGIEAVTIDISGGDTEIYPVDDGLNANGGSGDMPGFGGMPQGMDRPPFSDGSASDNNARQMHHGVSGNNPAFTGKKPGPPDSISSNDMPDERPEKTISGNMPSLSGSKAGSNDSSADEEETYIKISGGTLTIINTTGQDADGIDSNGDIIITGGSVRVSLVNNGNNSALDYASESGGVAKISGGTIVACGNYSMAEQFDSSSDQISVLYNFSEGADAGTRVALEDNEGNVLLEYEVPQTFSSLNLSCPDIKLGESYLLKIGDKTEKITIEETAASFGDTAAGGFRGRPEDYGDPARSVSESNTLPDKGEGEDEEQHALHESV